MASIKVFTRSEKSEFANIRYRISDGRQKTLYYTSNIFVPTGSFSLKNETISKSAKISPAEKQRITTDIILLKNKILEIYAIKKPTTSKELKTYLDNSQIDIDFEYIFKEFINKDVSKARLIQYKAFFREINEFDNNFCLDKITASTIDGIIIFYKNKNLAMNTIVSKIRILRTFFNFAIANNYTTNYPFKEYKIPAEVVGTPIYLNTQERDYLYSYDFNYNQLLDLVRDMFILQCYLGCRVSNLLKLTYSNIKGDYLEYIADKTIKSSGKIIRVPLHNVALEIIAKYKNGDNCDKLLPFMSDVKYNLYLKEVFYSAGLNRKVTVLNPKTRKEEITELYKIATSHMARRTFIGNLYKKVKDPNLIGSMSGHCLNSNAFARYREIDDEIKLDVINLL